MPDLELKTIAPKAQRDYLETPTPAPEDNKQRSLMLGSLCLLLLALGIVLWHDRDFWFPDDTAETESGQPEESSAPDHSAVNRPPAQRLAPNHSQADRVSADRVSTDRASTNRASATRSRLASSRTDRSPLAANSPRQSAMSANRVSAAKPQNQATAQAATPATADSDPPPVAISRTVLPPLEVEVVAGDNHRTVRPGSNSVHVDLQPGTSPEPAPDAVTGNASDTDNAARLTNDAAERVQMSANASEIVTRPVKPSYPLLARQMKVQGSVILQAMIGRDGIIQNLRLVSGPHILAGAAEDAVRQWHFKPHFQGNEAVETQAKITVNFTISTN
jgi:TonB family protein